MANMLQNIDFGKLDKHKQTIIDWFHKDSIDKATFSVMNRKDFSKQLTKICKDKKVGGAAVKLFKTINSKIQIKDLIDILDEVNLGKLSEYKQQIIEIFETDQMNKENFIKMSRKDFIGKITKKCNNKKLTSPAGKLFKTICTKITSEQNKNDMKNEDEKKQEPQEEKKDEFPDTFPDDYDNEEVDFEHRGYQEFQVWMENWRNIQHRLRYLTFIICKYLNKCTPSIIQIRIPKKK
eukprot:506957_1